MIKFTSRAGKRKKMYSSDMAEQQLSQEDTVSLSTFYRIWTESFPKVVILEVNLYRGVSTEPPFLAGYVINLICTVKDPVFMEPPFCLLASYTTSSVVS